MFLLIPLWHEDTLRFPVVTTGLILVNLVVFAIGWPLQKKHSLVVSDSRWQDINKSLVRILSDPESRLSENDQFTFDQQKDIEPFPSPELVSFFHHIEENHIFMSRLVEFKWDDAYAVFKAYEKGLEDRPITETLYDRYGFNPLKSWLPGLLTHQFLHFGFMHFFFNMLFLWVTGCVIEESVRGKLVWIYLLGGVAAAISQLSWALPKGEVMVGASGAIAALMGYALFSMPQAKIKLFYFLMLFIMPKFGIFNSPLWFFFPIWLLMQIFMAMMTAKSAVVNVGYAAHIGGFLFGGVAAFFLSNLFTEDA